MKLVVGLGNPGRSYADTRHNVGWWVVDHLADGWRLEGWRKDFEQLAATRGIGWVITVREESGGAVYNTWVDEHQWGTTAGTDVIFLLDLWEHAYLFDFAPTERGKYLETVFNNVDWGVVAARLNGGT